MTDRMSDGRDKEDIDTNSRISYFDIMNRKRKNTLKAVFDEPIRSDVLWGDIEKLVVAYGGYIEEGKGSRVRMELNGVRAVFHRPHPAKETGKGALKSVRRFLSTAGVKYEI